MAEPESVMKKQGVYVDLDALLDTRLSTIVNVVGQEAALQVLEKGYFVRKSDTFFNVDKEAYDKAYAERGAHTLKNATVTKVMRLMHELVHAMNKQAVGTPLHTGPRIFINTFPYVLTDAEESMIVRGIAAATNKVCDVIALNVSPGNLTPSYCKDNFTVMFKYDYPVWFEAQAKAFEVARCPALTCIVPALYFVKEPSTEELEQLVKADMHPLSAMEMLSSVFIDLKLYEPEIFSANLANNLEDLKSYKRP